LPFLPTETKDSPFSSVLDVHALPIETPNTLPSMSANSVFNKIALLTANFGFTIQNGANSKRGGNVWRIGMRIVTVT
jgi:hypothetical protein